MASSKRKKVQITNYVIMRMFNEVYNNLGYSKQHTFSTEAITIQKIKWFRTKF